MNNTYYWLHARSECENLGTKLYESNCKGFYVPYTFFDNEKTRESVKETILALRKEVILYNNYNLDFRPTMIPEIKLKENLAKSSRESAKNWERLLEKKQEATDRLKLFCDKKEKAIEYINENYERYLGLKSFLQEKENTRGIDNFFSQFLESKIKVLEFEFPFITLPPINDLSKYQDLSEMYELIVELNDFFFDYQKNKSKFKNSIYNVTLSMDDLKNNKTNIKKMVERINHFPNVAFWIVDYNELYSTKEHIRLLNSFLSQIAQEKQKVFFKFVGIFSNRLLRLINDNWYSIVRLNGYPGQNINLTALIPRTRRLLDPKNGDYLSLSKIGERFQEEYSCDCNMCKRNYIDSYKKASDFYLRDDPENSEYYKKYIGKAIVTKRQKLRGIQNQKISKHCFHNLELNMNLDFHEFCLKFEKSKNFTEWAKVYKEAV